MSDWSIFLISFTAIAIGWLLGKIDISGYVTRFKNRAWHKSYMQGIHFLLNEVPDHAIEDFIKESHVNAESFELHNALANMLRRKGEVDRAIRIHANLVESGRLSKDKIRIATIELASDYISAGLLDSAERLLINIINNSKEFEERPLELLQQIYQKEKEWGKAITVAEQLLPKKSVMFDEKRLSSGKHCVEIAHYYCEIAGNSLQEQNFRAAENALHKALEVYPACARATLIRAELALGKNNNTLAVAILGDLSGQDAHLLIDALPLLERCFLNDPSALISYLKRLLDDFPSLQIARKIYQQLKQVDEPAATLFLREQVTRHPTLQGLDLLIQDQLSLMQGVARENLLLLGGLVSDILKNRAIYKCSACGFSGMQMHWLCPKCNEWDSIRRIRGIEGD